MIILTMRMRNTNNTNTTEKKRTADDDAADHDDEDDVDVRPCGGAEKTAQNRAKIVPNSATRGP